MAHSNNQNEIKAGLVNYIGAIIQSSPYEDQRAVKHNVAAILLEEASTIMKDENNYFDMYACKPLIRLMRNVCKERIGLLGELERTPIVKQQMKSYEVIEELLEDIVKNIKF